MKMLNLKSPNKINQENLGQYEKTKPKNIKNRRREEF